MNVLRTLRQTTRNLRKYLADEHVSLMPFIKDLKSYNRAKWKADFHAAVNVALLDIPQGMAYATIAELPIAFGVTCSIAASIISPFFSGSRHTILGPTNATALMLFGFFAADPILAARETQVVPFMVLMVGIFCLIGALLRVADLLQYISRSVLVGYVTGAAVLIMANQSKHLLGIAYEVDQFRARSFIGLADAMARSLHAAAWQPILIGGFTLLLFLSLRRWKPKWPSQVIVLVLASAIFGTLHHRQLAGFEHVAMFRTFTLGDLIPSWPDLHATGVFEIVSATLGGALGLAFLACLENTIMVKTIASRTGDRPDVNQDMFALGMANIASSLVGGMTASGSPVRSMLNFTQGAQTRFSSLYSGLTVLTAALIIAWLPRYGISLIDYVPKAAVGALILGIAVRLFNLHNIRVCLRTTPDDAMVLIATFAATLIAPLHVAIFIGVALSITFFLRKASRPFLAEYEFNEAGELREMAEKRQRPISSISIVHVEGDLFFGAAELFRTQIQRAVSDPALRIIILRLKNARHLDATSVLALEDLIKFMRSKELHLIVSGATKEVYRVLKKSGVLLTLQEGCNRRAGESNLFLTSPRNPNISTRNALKRAQQLLGDGKAQVRIFYDPTKHSPE